MPIKFQAAERTYTQEELDEIAAHYPPPGHPHYMPIEERLGIGKYRVVPKETPVTASAALQKFTDLRQKIADAKKQMEDTAKSLFNEIIGEFFAENPEIVSIRWEQYTPYYCDGDVCTFRSNHDYPTISIMVDGQEWSYDSNHGELLIDGEAPNGPEDLIRTFNSMGVDEFKKNGKTYTFDKKTQTVYINGDAMKTYDESIFDPFEKKVKAFMKHFEDDDLLVMFGDHAQVTVHRDGTIEVEEYEHD